MTPDQARQVIQEALTQVAPDADIAGLTPDADLRDGLELDSLDFLRFVEILSERTGKQIAEDGELPVPTAPGSRGGEPASRGRGPADGAIRPERRGGAGNCYASPFGVKSTSMARSADTVTVCPFPFAPAPVPIRQPEAPAGVALDEVSSAGGRRVLSPYRNGSRLGRLLVMRRSRLRGC